VAAALADRLARQTLFDHSSACYHPWQPKDVRSLELTVAVEEVSDREVRLCLQGSVHLEAAADEKMVELTRQVRAQPRRRCLPASEDEKPAYRYVARLLGYQHYDRRKGAFTRFDVVALGDNTGKVDLGHVYYVTRPYRLGVAMEIAAPGRLVPPVTIRYACRGY
jgi:hypothetical protein